MNEGTRPSRFFSNIKIKREHMASTCTSQWSIDDVISTSRGSKVALLKGDCTGNQCIYVPPSHLRVPFEPGNFDKDPSATRLNLVLECDDDLQAEICKFDAWAVQYITEHSERLLKRNMSYEQVAAGYSSCMKHPQSSSRTLGKNFKPTLKTKIDLGDRRGLRCWNPNGEIISTPTTWRGSKIRPRIHYSHLWIMGSQYGCVLKVTDAEFAPDCVDEPETITNPFK